MLGMPRLRGVTGCWPLIRHVPATVARLIGSIDQPHEPISRISTTINHHGVILLVIILGMAYQKWQGTSYKQNSRAGSYLMGL